MLCPETCQLPKKILKNRPPAPVGRYVNDPHPASFITIDSHGIGIDIENIQIRRNSPLA